MEPKSNYSTEVGMDTVPRQVPTALQELDCVVENLDHLFRTLRERLSPITVCVPEKNSGETKGLENSVVPLAESIVGNTKRLRYLASEIDTLISRIEI